LPENEIEMSISAFVKDVLGFHDDEEVWFAEKRELSAEDGDEPCDDGEVRFSQWAKSRPVKELALLDRFSGIGWANLGSYVAVNPFKAGSAARAISPIGFSG
jgi:hypothetical protein